MGFTIVRRSNAYLNFILMDIQKLRRESTLRQNKGCLLVIIITLFSSNISAQVTPVVFAEGFTNPVSIAHAGDERLFIVERGGTIRIIDGAENIVPTPFLDISGITRSGGEQGLLGLAFHPDYAEKGYFFVNYTNLDGNTVIARYSVSAEDSDQADPESRQEILSIEQPYSNHNGGDLKFGADGYLYIGMGDGGASGDPQNYAQDLTSLLGKMLRIDIDNGTPYSIPLDNPYIRDDVAADEIWASGLRNPWRFSFDRQTGDLWIADVGQNAIEEVNYVPSGTGAGLNFGWRCYEGEAPFNTDNCGSSGDYTFPLYQYYHSEDNGCSVTGGYVYRGTEFPSLNGYYFFSDYCNDILYSLHDSSGQWVLTKHGQFPENNFTTFGEDQQGELYVAGISSGIVYKLTTEEEPTGFTAPVASPWKIYPNPAQDHIYLSSNGHGQLPEIVRVFNASGDLVREFTPKDPGETMEIRGIPPGVFLVEITTSGKTTHERLIVVQ